MLELRARLLRLADSVLENRTSSTADSPKPPAPRQQTNLEKAEAMACFVARNYTSRIQVKDIAECVGLHPDYAATLFRKTFGTTLNVLITRHRVAHAQRQLVTSDERIVNIAQDSGFDSLSRFNRAFKQLAGTTPRQYRKTLGQSPDGSAPRPSDTFLEESVLVFSANREMIGNVGGSFDLLVSPPHADCLLITARHASSGFFGPLVLI